MKKNKILMIIIFIVVFIIFDITLLIGFNFIALDETFTTNDNSTNTIEEKIDNTNEYNAYKSILEEWKEYFIDDNPTEEKYSNVNNYYVINPTSKEYVKENLYYTYYDIDNNGTREMIVLEGNLISDKYYYEIKNIYTYINNSTYKLLDVTYRSSAYIYTNGIIYERHSNSSASGIMSFYEIKNNELEKINSTCYEYFDGETMTLYQLEDGDCSSNKDTIKEVEDPREKYVNNSKTIDLSILDWYKIS
jgi:hypothetical protein